MRRRALFGSALALSFAALGAVYLRRFTASLAPSGAFRVVSLSPALTETVAALGAAEALVGVSDYCELPTSRSVPRVGTSLTPSYEAILALGPTLVLCDDSAAAKRRELSALATCEFLPWLTLSDVVTSTRRLGALLGRSTQAHDLALALERRLSSKPPRGAPRVLLLLSYDASRPGDIWFIKRNSLHGSALSAAGAENAVGHDVAGLPRLAVEELLRLDPDVVLIIRPERADAEKGREQLRSFSALTPLRAVQGGRVRSVAASHSVGPSILKLVDALAAELRSLEPAAASGLPG